MFLKRRLKFRRSLALKLTAWYAGIFTLSMFIAFLAFYFLVSSVLMYRGNQDLLDDIKECSALLASEGLERLKRELAWDVESDGVENVFYRLLSLDGKEIAVSNMTPWKGIEVDRTVLDRIRNGEKYLLQILKLPERENKVRIVYGIIAPGVVLQIGESMEEDSEFLMTMRKGFLPIMVSVMLFASLTGWFMGKRAMEDVEKVTEAAVQISRGAFDRRVNVKSNGDEIERLATAFNTMIEKINLLIREIKDVGDSIAHDLRSPLARIRASAEMTLLKDIPVEQYKTMAANTVEECDRLLGVINTMMDIAEAEAGALRLKLEQVDLAKTIREACELFRAVAEDKEQQIIEELQAECVIWGDSRKLQRMISNLLDNALKYTPPGGRVTVSTRRDEETVTIKVEDTGTGISQDDLPHIFKQFYRCDQSRSKQGSGLGLSLVRAIVISHGGEIAVKSSLGEGTIFTIVLPRGRPPSEEYKTA